MDNLKLILQEELLALPYANKDYTRDIIMLRCPFCGDSVKHHDSTHFGVFMNLNDNKPIGFNCLRCGIGGILDQRTLRLLGSYDKEINNAVCSYNTTSLKTRGESKLYDKSKVKLAIPKVIVNDRSLRKHEYIEKRLGLKLDMQELADKKVIYNFANLLKDNNIKHINCSGEFAYKLQNEYVGFLSARNEYINFRNTKSEGLRWYIYNVMGRLDNTRKFYFMPNKIDIFSKNTIIINICEGAFDALGIYYHIFDKEDTNMFYVAACGAGFISVLKYILSMGVTCNVDINIFSDSDRPPKFYKKLKTEIAPWVNNITLYYNTKSKDYGVTKNEISLIKKKI